MIIGMGTQREEREAFPAVGRAVAPAPADSLPDWRPSAPASAEVPPARAPPRRRRHWSPEFVDFALYVLFLACLCVASVAGGSSAPYFTRRNLEDLFLVNEFESNVAYEGIAAHSQIRTWLGSVASSGVEANLRRNARECRLHPHRLLATRCRSGRGGMATRRRPASLQTR